MISFYLAFKSKGLEFQGAEVSHRTSGRTSSALSGTDAANGFRDDNEVRAVLKLLAPHLHDDQSDFSAP